MTVCFPVWHSHCARTRFTALVLRIDELAVLSCPLLCLQRRLRKSRDGCSAVDLYCVTITWQQIFKSSLQLLRTTQKAFCCMCLMNADILLGSWI